MTTSTTAVLCFFLFLLPLSINAAIFQIVNNCSFTVWAAWAFAVVQAGGGDQLNPSQFLAINVEGTTGGRIWARTGCSFDGSGQGNCQTGDCGGVLQCQRYGRPPNTFAEFTLNQFQNLDFDISNMDGYNVGIDISPTSGGCRGIRCSANIVGECPARLRAPGGCNNPCTVFRTAQYCCATGSCGPTNYSRFFKTRCPDAYSYPQDNATSTSTCPPGTDYRVTFCPGLHPTIMHGNDSNIGNDGITANIGNDSITANIGNIKLIVTIRLRR